MAKKTSDKKRAVKRPAGVDAKLARHGALSYLEISALDPRKSAAFYESVCGWKVQGSGTDNPKFVDREGYLIGRWVKGVASHEPGLLPYIYVNQIDDAVQQSVTCGGEIVKLPYSEGNLWVAKVRDPSGNIVGLWQEK